MPRKKKAVTFVDPLARRLSFRDALWEDEATGRKPSNHTVYPNGVPATNVRNGHNIRLQQEVSISNSNTYVDDESSPQVPQQSPEQPDVFPVFIYVILALIATFFILGEANKIVFSYQYDLSGIIKSLCWSLLLGLACTAVSWMVTFSDSLEPGSNPPSPMSPQKVRDRSGHTFHSNYVICLANGVLTFAVCFWYLSS